jgi:hypothetical protein
MRPTVSMHIRGSVKKCVYCSFGAATHIGVGTRRIMVFAKKKVHVVRLAWLQRGRDENSSFMSCVSLDEPNLHACVRKLSPLFLLTSMHLRDVWKKYFKSFEIKSL